MKYKKGDNIIVTIGKDRGKKGKIDKILVKKDQIVVNGINVYKRHMKSRGEGKPGGIIDIVKPMNVAKVALVCPKCNQPTRVGYKILKDEKIRICRKCEEAI